MKVDKTNRLTADLAKARAKAAEWQARVREIERKITERENLEILRTIRGMASSPEELRALLNQIQAAKEPSNLTGEESNDNKTF